MGDHRGLCEVRADLDVPGETARQTQVLLVWLVCLAVTVALAIRFRPVVPPRMRGTGDEHRAVSEARGRRLPLVLLFGLGLPLSASWWITYRRRRGGPHARGIVVDVVEGELRVWGRGYGQRVRLDGADITERLVDVYTGRMGMWRQRRMVVRAARSVAGHPTRLELATPAGEADAGLGLGVTGGEGDCLELARGDYLAVLEAARALASAGER